MTCHGMVLKYNGIYIDDDYTVREKGGEAISPGPRLTFDGTCNYVTVKYPPNLQPAGSVMLAATHHKLLYESLQ